MYQNKILKPKNFILYLFGFLIPFPLFFDIASGQFVFIEFDMHTITTSSGQPAPLALFIFPLVILLKIKFKEILNYLLIIFILFLSNLNLFDKLTLIRYLTLIIIPIFFYVSYDFSKKDYSSFSKGYLKDALMSSLNDGKTQQAVAVILLLARMSG
mgnify:CR=1 FL=1